MFQSCSLYLGVNLVLNHPAETKMVPEPNVQSSPPKYYRIQWGSTRKEEIAPPVIERKRPSTKRKVELETPIPTEYHPNIPPPTSITVPLSESYNLFDLDSLLRHKFEYERTHTLDSLRTQQRYHQHRLSIPMNLVERKSILLRLDSINREINRIDTEISKHEYERLSTPILTEYSRIGILPKVIRFGTTKTQDLPPEESKTRLRLLSKYLEIASRFIPIYVTQESPAIPLCPGCGFDIGKIGIDTETGFQTCPECGYQEETIIQNTITADPNSLVTTKSGYDDLDNFILSLDRDECKQPIKLKPSLFHQLDTYFGSFDLPTGDQIRDSPMINGKKKGTSYELMRKALKETGNSGYYEDVKLICHLYWGWDPVNYSSYRSQIIDDYKKLQEIYIMFIRDRDSNTKLEIPIYGIQVEFTFTSKRKSNLNIEYRKFKHLEMRGFPCSISDFKMIETRSILQEHDQIWEVMIEIAIQMYPDDGFRFIRTL